VTASEFYHDAASVGGNAVERNKRKRIKTGYYWAEVHDDENLLRICAPCNTCRVS